MLREYADEEELRRRCYTRNHETIDITNYILNNDSASPAEVREIFYKVTGTPFTSSLPMGLDRYDTSMLNQSFDDDYQFFGNLTRKAKYLTQDDQVGNAVPPLLAKSIADHIKGFI